MSYKTANGASILSPLWNDDAPNDYRESAPFLAYVKKVDAVLSRAKHPLSIREIRLAVGGNENIPQHWVADALDLIADVHHSWQILPTRYFIEKRRSTYYANPTPGNKNGGLFPHKREAHRAAAHYPTAAIIGTREK